MNNNEVLWNNFLEVLKTKISSVSFDTWFKDTKLIKKENSKLLIQVPMTFHKSFLNDTYYDLIDEIITNITGNSFDLEFIVEDQSTEDEDEKIDINIIYNHINSNLNPKYTFANFVIGESNRFAQTAAVAVAEQPGKIYNPLFIHGKSGLGKTHLMHAIGNYVTENSEKKVLYVTSEEFISDFIGINKKQGNNYDIVDHFKKKYRNIDILLIDDIQFLGGAEKTQHEFFHTFNTLYDSNKQIIISSDRSPDDLKLLEDRLRTRFRWGLTVDIYPPNFELRCKILKDKMTGHEVASLIKEEVIEYIATNCENDVRHLEGAITRLYAYSAIMNPKEINLDFAIEALKDYIGKSIYINNNITKIQKAVADYYKITIEDLKSKKRTTNISYPRHIAIYLCRMTTEETTTKIGLEFGNRDHSTVLYSYDKINYELKDNNKLKIILEEIKNNIVN
ncbi:MAG: chromosomal replication initiator protein DnaA [Bacilli bacterium]|nr:chromosomal replication initiator protein DnaA [Bacilli bacterium]